MDDNKKNEVKKAWYIKPEMIIALSALLISVVTTITSIYSAYVDRAYAKASVWPRLEISRTYFDDTFGYVLSNSGNGPALVKYAIVEFSGNHIETWDEIPFTEDVNSISQSHMSSRVIPAHETFKPLLLKTANLQLHLKNDRKTKITLCYCSIYDECWLINRKNQPQEVPNCKAPSGIDLFTQ